MFTQKQDIGHKTDLRNECKNKISRNFFLMYEKLRNSTILHVKNISGYRGLASTNLAKTGVITCIVNVQGN